MLYIVNMIWRHAFLIHKVRQIVYLLLQDISQTRWIALCSVHILNSHGLVVLFISNESQNTLSGGLQGHRYWTWLRTQLHELRVRMNVFRSPVYFELCLAINQVANQRPQITFFPCPWAQRVIDRFLNIFPFVDKYRLVLGSMQPVFIKWPSVDTECSARWHTHTHTHTHTCDSKVHMMKRSPIAKVSTVFCQVFLAMPAANGFVVRATSVLRTTQFSWALPLLTVVCLSLVASHNFLY